MMMMRSCSVAVVAVALLLSLAANDGNAFSPSSSSFVSKSSSRSRSNTRLPYKRGSANVLAGPEEHPVLTTTRDYLDSLSSSSAAAAVAVAVVATESEVKQQKQEEWEDALLEEREEFMTLLTTTGNYLDGLGRHHGSAGSSSIQQHQQQQQGTAAAGDFLNFSIVANGTAAAVKKNRQQYQWQREQQQQQQEDEDREDASLLEEGREDFIAFVDDDEPVEKKEVVLSQVDKGEERQQQQNSFADWLDFSIIPRDDAVVASNNKGNSNNIEQQQTSRMLLWPSLYGTFGVVFILIRAIKRVLPVALEPLVLLVRSPSPPATRAAGILKTNFFLHQNAVPKSPPPLTNLQLGIYAATCLLFAYLEGYRGFQKKFAPLVVKRSFTLVPPTTDAASADGSVSRKSTRSSPWWHLVLAPLYSMGLFHATAKRAMISRCVTLGVAALVVAVKKLPYPHRNIVDAGVVTGLAWGCISLSILYAKAWIRKEHPPGVSAELPPAATTKTATTTSPLP